MTTVRWGIVGCGDVTEVKSGPGFQKARGSALVAVMRRDPAKAEDYARRHGVPRWYGDAGPLSLYYPSRRMLPAKTRVFVEFVVERFRSAGFARLVDGR